jgi:hypothetical protein
MTASGAIRRRALAALIVVALAVFAASAAAAKTRPVPRPSYSAPACADGAPVSSCKDALASAIANRLNALGDTTDPMTAAEGYFYGNPILPQQAFYTYGGCEQAFKFSVFVYKTAAQAASMEDDFYEHVLDIGGDFRDFNMFRHGRVIYLADTAPRPGASAAAVPTQDFHALAAEVGAPLPAHPRGCPPPT